MADNQRSKIIYMIVALILSFTLAGCVSVDIGKPEDNKPEETIGSTVETSGGDIEEEPDRENESESGSESENIGDWSLYKESGGVASFEESEGKLI